MQRGRPSFRRSPRLHEIWDSGRCKSALCDFGQTPAQVYILISWLPSLACCCAELNPKSGAKDNCGFPADEVCKEIPIHRSDAGPRAGCLWINWLGYRRERPLSAASIFSIDLLLARAAILTANPTAKRAGISEERRRAAKIASHRRPSSWLISSRVHWVLAKTQFWPVRL